MNKNNDIQSKKNTNITILRVIACLLILNSHCGDFYPISILSFGGGQGNVIFFVVSGYCLAEIKLDFYSWIRKRYKKILPITFVTILFKILIIDRNFWLENGSIYDMIKYYIDLYWFVFAIMLYYVVLYIFVGKKSQKKTIFFLCLYVVVYFAIYIYNISDNYFFVELEGFSLMKVIYYCGPFIAGAFVRVYQNNKNEKKIKIYIIGMLVGLLVWAGEYIYIMMGNHYEWQFLIHVGNYLFGVSVLKCAIVGNQIIVVEKIKKVVECISDNTLAIYLLQVTVVSYFNPIVFPINIVAFWLFSIVMGCIYGYCFDIINLIYSKKDKKGKKI